MSTPIRTFWNRIFVWTRRDLKSLGRNFENNAVSVTGLPGFVRKEGYWFRVQKVCILKNIQIRVDVALNARGFGWLSLHTVYFQVKKDCLRTRLSTGESNIYGKTTSPRQLIFWAIGWLIWIKETHKKKVKRISCYPHNKLEAREGIKKHLTYTVTKKSFSQ